MVRILFLLTSIILLTGCEDSSKKSNSTLIHKNFGNWRNQNTDIGVALKLTNFKSFKELKKRVDEIVCNDSLPKINIHRKDTIKTIYVTNPCWEQHGSVLIKSKNIIQIYNDTITQSYKNFYPLDSIALVMRKNIENHGKNPDLCDSPDKLIVYISYDKAGGIEKISKTLDQITDVYEKITNRTDIKIWFAKTFDYSSTKIPVPKPVEIELIEEEH